MWYCNRFFTIFKSNWTYIIQIQVHLKWHEQLISLILNIKTYQVVLTLCAYMYSKFCCLRSSVKQIFSIMLRKDGQSVFEQYKNFQAFMFIHIHFRFIQNRLAISLCNIKTICTKFKPSDPLNIVEMRSTLKVKYIAQTLIKTAKITMVALIVNC